MGDNIRPALYDSSYEAVVANRPLSPPEETVTLVGKFCESGDYLIKDINLPVLNQDDYDKNQGTLRGIVRGMKELKRLEEEDESSDDD